MAVPRPTRSFDSVSSISIRNLAKRRREIPLFLILTGGQIVRQKNVASCLGPQLSSPRCPANSDYQRLLDATIEHVSELKAQGIRSLPVSPDTLQALAGKIACGTARAKAPASIVPGATPPAPDPRQSGDG